jgi:hypothetical protein
MTLTCSVHLTINAGGPNLAFWGFPWILMVICTEPMHPKSPSGKPSRNGAGHLAPDDAVSNRLTLFHSTPRREIYSGRHPQTTEQMAKSTFLHELTQGWRDCNSEIRAKLRQKSKALLLDHRLCVVAS